MKGLICGVIGVLCLQGVARAEDVVGERAPLGSASAQDVLGANYSILLHGPLIGGRATLQLSGGWDTSLERARAELDGWLHVYGPLSLTLGASHGTADAWRPAGASVLWMTSETRAGMIALASYAVAIP